MLDAKTIGTLASIMDGKSEADLVEMYEYVILKLKNVRDLQSRIMKNSLHIGDKVYWHSRKRSAVNGQIHGVVSKINKVKAVVDVKGPFNTTHWTVPMNMLIKE